MQLLKGTSEKKQVSRRAAEYAEKSKWIRKQQNNVSVPRFFLCLSLIYLASAYSAALREISGSVSLYRFSFGREW
jgi:hypothetical protein